LPFSFLAGIVVLVHLGFLGFVLFGGLFFPRWSWLIWLHLPAVTYAVLVEVTGWRCLLTELEKWLRRRSGQEPYGAGFIPHYLRPPRCHTPSDILIALAFVAAIVLVNARAYLSLATA
jgi:hypothetical protein